MLQRALQIVERRLLHVAIIMDGNGRWAAARGLPRTAGHRAGATAVRRAVEAAPALGVGTLTLYAFSSDNWRRPAREVWALMRLLRHYLRAETARCVREGVRLRVIGRRDRLSPEMREEIAASERATAGGRTLDLRIAVDYSSRDAILRAACALGERASSAASAAAAESPSASTRECFARLLDEDNHIDGAACEVDLLIRTGGEQRLSDFLLWECAYAELYFTARMWPDFATSDFRAALESFHARERRFGGVPEATAAMRRRRKRHVSN